MPAEIRRALPEDAEAIAAVLWSSRRAAMPWLRERYTHTEAHDWVGRVLLVTATVWVAVKAEQVVGYAALEGGLLGQLYVAPISAKGSARSFSPWPERQLAHR